MEEWNSYFVLEEDVYVYNANVDHGKEITGNGKVNRKIDISNLDKDLLSTKPMHSPDPKKWIEKNGGSITIDETGMWTYINKEGKSVSYPGGFADFTPYKHPLVDPVEIDVAVPSNPGADFKAANEKAGLSKESVPSVPDMRKPPDGYTWHYKEDGKTLILVDRKVHTDFRHIGGEW